MNTHRLGRMAQHGATLVVVLILLLVMTLLALASMRGTILEERMSANQYDRSLAFQAAEAALREGEAKAAGRPNPPTGGGCTDDGVCALPEPDATPLWQSSAVWAAAPVVVVEMGELKAQPKYIVELLADDVPPKGSCTTSGDVSDSTCTGTERRYRITARSQEAGRADVMLQSVYAVP